MWRYDGGLGFQAHLFPLDVFAPALLDWVDELVN